MEFSEKKLSREAKIRRNATNSLYCYLCACIDVLIKKLDWNFLIGNSKRRPKKMLEFFAVEKITDKSGDIIFDETMSYEIDKKSELVFNQKGYPIPKKATDNSSLSGSERTRSNQILLLHLFNFTLKNREIIAKDTKTVCTKKAQEGFRLSSERLEKLPIVNLKNEIVHVKREEAEKSVGCAVHKFLSNAFKNLQKTSVINLGDCNLPEQNDKAITYVRKTEYLSLVEGCKQELAKDDHVEIPFDESSFAKIINGSMSAFTPMQEKNFIETKEIRKEKNPFDFVSKEDLNVELV
ncbi:hypothetical protein EIN_430700 [Entamoeba invadens IP1]|uniref:Uncharacterized protein n=1 Tax=Entamoeba invadens IP1 TaxID=370355 RepID=A0A0A1UGY1_ENTIV|nr:hypothetical protein EIN_430700 [Entamoeba invadens IP1]ELP95264.1 hypothetical protein EIN_430700 [Entamoeba invadens IP1]|eukprot:XP_004262035.1 hypothetical protein EIN_430700 [Entamoeba invadens IP1]